MSKFWKIQNKAEDEAEMLIYGEIADATWWGDEVTPQQFAADLKALGGKSLSLRINSPGGDVFAAQAIYNQLKAYGGAITAYIDGIAASAATIITCAADKVIMPDNAIFMIHDPKVGLCGYLDADACNAMAEQLGKVKQTIVNVYLKKCGDAISEDVLHQMMDAETWMTADEAQGYGFVDELGEPLQITNNINAGRVFMNDISFDMGRFKHADKLQAMINRKRGCGNMNEKNILDKIKNLLNGSQPETGEQQVDAVAAERARILDLDALRDGNEAVEKIVDIAKRNGNTAEEIQEYVDAVKGAAQPVDTAKGIEEIKNLVKDQLESGAGKIEAGAGADGSAGSVVDDVNSLVAAMKKVRGEV